MTWVAPKSFQRFYRRFYKEGSGRILVLSNEHDQFRDALAAMQIFRVFPIPDCAGIVPEPSRPEMPPHENLIVIGANKLFLDSAAIPVHDPKPVPVSEPFLRERLERVAKRAGLEIVGTRKRAIKNLQTGKLFEPRIEGGVDHDFGLVRRYVGSESTIIIEGVHLSGTLGATKVATNHELLSEIWTLLDRLDDFDEQFDSVEILLETTISTKRAKTLENIVVRPLYIVCRGQMVFDYSNPQRGWYDQADYDVIIKAEGGEEAEVVKPERETGTRVVATVDLRELDKAKREFVKNMLTRKIKVTTENVTKLLGLLSAQHGRFSIRLMKPGSRSGEMSIPVPAGRLKNLGRVRKHFVIHMMLCRTLNRVFERKDAYIRKYLPEYKPNSKTKSLSESVSSNVKGQLEAFSAIFGGEDPLMEIPWDRSTESYSLRLDKVPLFVKFRF